MLKDIAASTGGKYFRATDNNSLLKVYEEIDQLEKSKIDVRQFIKKEELFMPFAVAALILLFIDLLARLTIFRNIS